MTTSELKLYLLEKIIETTDIDLLLKIKSLLKKNNYAVLEENPSEINELDLQYEKNIRFFSPAEQRKIDQALKEYENGECISDEEAQIELEKWFKEQEK